MPREGAHPHPRPWDARGVWSLSEGSGFPWPSSQPRHHDFTPEPKAPQCLPRCFLFIPAVEINPALSEPGKRHELISYIWW